LILIDVCVIFGDRKASHPPNSEVVEIRRFESGQEQDCALMMHQNTTTINTFMQPQTALQSAKHSQKNHACHCVCASCTNGLLLAGVAEVWPRRLSPVGAAHVHTPHTADKPVTKLQDL
jgi:hypothetical protein